MSSTPTSSTDPLLSSSGDNQMNPPAEQQQSSGSKSRKRAAPGDNWLPPGWRVEEKARTSGATAGTVDKYYYEPITGRKFRSRTEVLYYLEHGTVKRSGKKSESSDTHPDHYDGQGSNKPGRKAKEAQPPPRPLNFDFMNPPEKVSWTVTIGKEEQQPWSWTAFIGDEKVRDSVTQDWSTAFTVFTTQNPSKLSY